MDMERELETLKQTNNDLQMKLASKDKNVHRFEKKIRNLEQENGMLQKTQTAYEYSKRELETEVSQRAMTGTVRENHYLTESDMAFCYL